jgi:hypothetical protein
MTIAVNKRDNTILKTIAVCLLLAGICLPGAGCGSSDTGDDPVPFVPFDEIVINLNLPTYNPLRSDGGYVYIDGGVRGLILYRQNATTYLAFERNCTFRPNEACATVEVHSSTLYMTDECCKSIFRFPDGEPNGGPASRPLIQYNTSLKGSELTISDERF